MDPGFRRKRQRVVFGNSQLRALAVINIITDGNDRIQSVIASAQLKHNKHFVARPQFSGTLKGLQEFGNQEGTGCQRTELQKFSSFDQHSECSFICPASE